MKTNDELMDRVDIKKIGNDGGGGIMTVPSGLIGSVVWSHGLGWEHVSFSPFRENKMPTWNDMCYVKNVFFRDDETVVQYHPKRDEYVNNLSNCLHLWRSIKEPMPEPPSFMVGMKKGQTMDDIDREVSEYEKWYREKYNDDGGGYFN